MPTPWGATRSPTIKLPPHVAPPTSFLLDAHRRHAKDTERTLQTMSGDGTSPSPTTSTNESVATHSTLLPSSAPVMETLVRRYRAAENALERWRLYGTTVGEDYHGIAYAEGGARAALRRSSGGAATGATQRRHSTRSALTDAILRHSGVARAVQSWWRQKKAAQSRVRVKHTAASASRAESAAYSPLAWIGQAIRRPLRRLSKSLALSSDRLSTTPTGENVSEALRGSATSQEPLSPVSTTSTSNDTEASSSDDGVEDVEEAAGTTASLRQSNLNAARATDDGRFTLSWIRGLRRPQRGHAAALLPSTSSSASTSPSWRVVDAEESFRSASRLLARSRARFSRWLRQQQRLQAAKRALSGARGRFLSRQGTTNVSRANTDASVADGNINGASNSETGSTWYQPHSPAPSALVHAGSAPLSAWQQPLPRPSDVHAPQMTDKSESVAAQRAQLRAALKRVIESVKASEAAASTVHVGQPQRHQKGLLKAENVSDASAAPGQLSLAEHQNRVHADALAQLTHSLTELARMRAGEATEERVVSKLTQTESSEKNKNRALLPDNAEAAAGTVNNLLGASGEAGTLSGHDSTILSSRRWSFRSHFPASGHNSLRATTTTDNAAPAMQKNQQKEEEEDGEVFRSLLVASTHTARDAAVRLAYEAVMQQVCEQEVQRAVDTTLHTSQEASNRALEQWVERQLLYALTSGTYAVIDKENKHPPAADAGKDEGNAIDADAAPLTFCGVLQHLKTNTPVSISHLRLDDADRRAVENVFAREGSEANAVTLATAGYSITYSQLASLSPQSWLNDQVINNYLQLLCEHVESQQQRTPSAGKNAEKKAGSPASTLHSIASMGTHFYSKVETELAGLASSAATAPYAKYVDGPTSAASVLPPLASNSAILRWLRRRQHLLEPFRASDPASVRAVLVPVNIAAQHWALAVFYREDRRWVLYDSMSRSDRAQARAMTILARLAHAWRECQQHFQLPVDAPTCTLEEQNLAVAAPYAPTTLEAPPTRALIESMAPFGNVEELHRAAKRLRHQEDLLEAEKEWGEEAGTSSAPTQQTSRARTDRHVTAATQVPSSMLSDPEVEWFTDGFAHAPQQRNGNDCGVFVCQAAWCVAQGVAVSFTQKDVTLLRQVILLELLSKKLLRRFPTEYTSSSADV